MELHKLLLRQLNRAQIEVDGLPKNEAQWQEFISRINKTYQETDQERYLLERSMNLSSHEMMLLNDKLERAQHIARLCYWHYDSDTDHISWSKELYHLLDLNPNAVQTFKEFLILVHPGDRDELKKLVHKALTKRIDYTFELRLKNQQDQYQWYRTIADCQGHDNELSGILIDIDRDKKNEAEIKELSQKLLMTARRAGMAEIATSILHNIGNVLNSSNVSVNLIKESFSQPYYQKLFKIISMLQDHKKDIGNYLTRDEKGKLIPEYLIALGEILDKSNEKNRKELDNLDEDIQHLKDIVAMQKAFSGVSSIAEKIYIPELIETALQMSSNPHKDKAITLRKQYVDSAFVFADKSKLLQILINLIQNAKDAISKNSLDKKKQIDFVVKTANKKLQIMITDNGEGILPENLQRIFSFGFTTKPNGHGFGLHSCALSAQDMGGSLKAESQGIGQGAVFTLTLPSENAKQKGVFNE
ncbi:sensor histidine kinase [Legionella hackeliae]|uniref:histidine kinase n=1 Tax=Legionella hackeliae TaxID=449 RepID=A0A0A8UXI4_LEGHA|nr:PAS domain-containing sensor histidine kinase [Legionella hackeliae]KTD15177.1 Two-component sensor histidine kinase [Legionella hackeliae]CEK11459.1 Two-component sensor histidine kinase [Legionella hackeliae]STX48230.1 Two-component sensor histidine kinase [Legionella hackeliae]